MIDRLWDFDLLTTLPSDVARIRFSGQFMDREVVWAAEVITLNAYAGRRCAQSGEIPNKGLRAFIDVGPEIEGLQTVLIGLPVDLIDEPTLRKSVVMLRNYKRLQSGRHEFGDVYRFHVK